MVDYTEKHRLGEEVYIDVDNGVTNANFYDFPIVDLCGILKLAEGISAKALHFMGK